LFGLQLGARHLVSCLAVIYLLCDQSCHHISLIDGNFKILEGGIETLCITQVFREFRYVDFLVPSCCLFFCVKCYDMGVTLVINVFRPSSIMY
jgi:hypothetical protein